METGKNKDGMISLNYPMLTRVNYTAWAMKMKVYMQAQGIWEAVSPKDPKASAAVDEKMDKTALAAIYHGIPEDVLLSLADKGTAKEAWEAIKTLCQGAQRVKTAKVQTLKAEFETVVMKDTDSVDDFSMKLSNLVTNIRALGEEMAESYVVKKLLRAVPHKFLQIASTIEQFGNLDTMTLEETVGSLKAHEERIKGQSDNVGGKLLLTREEWIEREREDESKLLLTKEEWTKRSNKGGSETSQRNRGKEYTRDNRDKSRVRCFNCSGYGHYAIECKKSRRGKEVKEEANMMQILDDEPALLMAESSNDSGDSLLLNEERVSPKLSQKKDEKGAESNLWYLDNGASNHMTGQVSKFHEIDTNVKGQVKFGDGSMVQIKGKGSITLQCKDGESRILSEVYYIPSLRSNIISLGQLSENGYRITLRGEHLWVHENNGDLLMKVKRSPNRLYKIIICSSETKCLMSRHDNESWLWHSRLGHVNFKALKLMSTTNMVRGMPRINLQNEVCSGCLMSKQVRKPFPQQSKFTAKKALELIHGDLCGPITPSTPGGNKYIFVLIDDYSRVMWTYLLKNKSEAFGAFKRFCALVENSPGKKIMTFRTDNGGEFTSKEFNQYCEEAGIVRHFSAPYSPQQNGVVERRNRTLIEMARSLLKEKNVPNQFWGEAVQHATYLINRLPTRAVTGITPYEAWSEKKPHVEHIRVFGCLAHMKTPSANLKKLDNRSKTVVYFGKEAGTKAFRLYDP